MGQIARTIMWLLLSLVLPVSLPRPGRGTPDVLAWCSGYGWGVRACCSLGHPLYNRRTSVVHPLYIRCTSVVHAYGLRSPQGVCTGTVPAFRSEEHTSELQSLRHLV